MSLLQSRLQGLRREALKVEDHMVPVPPVSGKQRVWREIKDRVMQEAVDVLDIETMEKMSGDERDGYLKEQIGVLVSQTLQDLDATLTRTDSLRMVDEIVSEITGYGPITPLLADHSVNEVMVNGPNQIYVERKGKIELTNITFRDDGHVMHLIHRIVAPLGKRIDESSPMVDGRLPDGSRFNATIPPISLTGPVLTIRKFSATPLSMADLIGFGTLSTSMGMFLKACVEGRLNIVVGGGTGSGKTTTLNVLSALIPSNERIITIEDAAELSLQQEHVVRLESRPVNVEGKGSISIRDLVINSLRMRPDRIVVGEVRGGEALDMLQAMNTGHDGSLTTAHANSPRDILSRLETMVLMAGMDLPVKAIRDQIASAIDLIVYQARFKDGSRKITAITEVAGMEGDVITLQDIFLFDEQGIGEGGKVTGAFRATGVIPRCLPRLNTAGIHVPRDTFA
ncbi:MAG TPA: CpaF family protein [Firmicutes bacterium]|nr:CpaF family protein [Candidatus Fermentithermobacillaceae bacterium]